MGLIALISAVVSAVATFLQKRDKEKLYELLAGGWAAFVTDARGLLSCELPQILDLAHILERLGRVDTPTPSDLSTADHARVSLRTKLDELHDEVQKLHTMEKALKGGHPPPLEKEGESTPEPEE